MDPLITEWMRPFVVAKGPFGRVLELGAREIENYGSIRPAFEGCGEYVGLDMIEGPGVDVVMNAHELEFGDDERLIEPFDCVVATSFFEHDAAFWLSLRGVRAMLAHGGWFVMTVPFLEWGVHDYPGDYYRYTPQAIQEVLFDGFQEFHLTNPIPQTQHFGAWGRWP